MTIQYGKIAKRIPGFKNVLLKLDGLSQDLLALEKINGMLIKRVEELEQELKRENEIFERRRQLVNDKIGELNVKSKRYDYSAEKLGEVIPQVRKSEKAMNELNQKIDKLNRQLDKNTFYCLAAQKAANESVWSSVYHDTIWNSRWLLNQKFSPGRWAVGYQFLYVLYRVLDEMNPKNILELGLGQSTSMITQYIEYYPETKHMVVEHDPDWIEFYKRENHLSPSSEIKEMELCKKIVNDDLSVTAYNRFSQTLCDNIYDLISVDAPLGAPCNIYARTDILEIIPSCLSNDFVIMFDDYNRSGEKNTVELIKKKLEESEIKFCTGIYSGNKDTLLIVPQHLHFLTTL